MDDNLIKIVKKHALDNARKHNGSPNMGAVIGKLIGECPEAKQHLKEYSKKVKEICEEVASMDVDCQIGELEKLAPELLEEKKIVEEKKLKPLPNAEKGKVVMRLAPSPSGPMHVGHSIVFSLSHLYCKEYEGKLILRLEDTNPENIYTPAYKMIEDDTQWFTEGGIHEIQIQSDRLEVYYDKAEKMISKGAAYVCTCSAEMFRNFSLKKKACACRDLDIKEHLLRWDKMFIEYQPGQAVMRIKTDIEHPNPALRDWPALRINHHEHPKKGTDYKVWPLMNFAVPIDDHELGITHTIRGKDMADSSKRQKYIYDFFEWKEPTHQYVGRISIEGVEVSKTKTKLAIERGEFDDWDDIRLPFMAGLKRRGFQPGAFQKFAIDIGLGMNDKKVPADEFFKMLEAHNRDIIDPIANRYFFVCDPVKVEFDGAEEKEVSLHLHPDDKERGRRVFKVGKEFYLPKKDLDKVEDGKLYRLMDCFNFKKSADKYTTEEDDLQKYRKEGSGTMHWLPVSSELVEVEVLMTDKSVLKGFGEPVLKDLEVGSIIQFERFGFCRLDKKEGNKLVFWWTHK